MSGKDDEQELLKKQPIEVRIISDEDDDEIDLRELLQSLWTGKWLIALCVVLTLAVGMGYLQLKPRELLLKAPLEIYAPTIMENNLAETVENQARLIKQNSKLSLESELLHMLQSLTNGQLSSWGEVSVDLLKDRRGKKVLGHELQLGPIDIERMKSERVGARELKQHVLEVLSGLRVLLWERYLEHLQEQRISQLQQTQDKIKIYDQVLAEQAKKKTSFQFQVPSEYFELQVSLQQLQQTKLDVFTDASSFSQFLEQTLVVEDEGKIQLEDKKLNLKIALVLFTLLGGFLGVMIVLFRKVL